MENTIRDVHLKDENFFFFSFISGVTILGTPAEIYNFGTQYWITIISILFSGLVVALIYAPVFVALGLNSVYEVYLSKTINTCNFYFHCFFFFAVLGNKIQSRRKDSYIVDLYN